MKSLLNILPISAASQPMNLADYLRLSNNKTVEETYGQPTAIVNLIVKNLFVVAGILIFFLIIGAGLSFMQNTDKGKEDAKNLATGAVIGLVVMFAAYWIVQIIKFVTGTDIPI